MEHLWRLLGDGGEHHNRTAFPHKHTILCAHLVDVEQEATKREVVGVREQRVAEVAHHQAQQLGTVFGTGDGDMVSTSTVFLSLSLSLSFSPSPRRILCVHIWA